MTNKQDNYALDDTLEGRITQAAALGVMLSYPDWIKSPTTLRVTYGLSFAAFGALVAITNAQDEDEADDEAVIEQTAENEPQQWAVAIGTVLAVILGLLVSRRLAAKLAERMRKEGFPKPWTLLGALGATLIFWLSEAEARRHATA